MTSPMAVINISSHILSSQIVSVSVEFHCPHTNSSPCCGRIGSDVLLSKEGVFFGKLLIPSNSDKAIDVQSKNDGYGESFKFPSKKERKCPNTCSCHHEVKYCCPSMLRYAICCPSEDRGGWSF